MKIFNDRVKKGNFGRNTRKYSDLTLVFNNVDTTDKSNFISISTLSNFSKIFGKLIYP